MSNDRQRAQQIKRLEACLAKPENRECFDCCALRPRWASTNLGIFICMRCAGIHRSLGVHISKVKSINMDKWEEDMIRSCETIGNGPVGKFKYEANLPAGYSKPKMNTEDREVDRQIRLKFESKLYYPRPDQSPPTGGPTAAAAAVPAPPKEAHVTATVTTGGGGKVVQAVAVDEPDLFGEFASARAGAGNPQFSTEPAAKPASSNNATDFFGGGQNAPAPKPQASVVDPFADAGGPVQQASRPSPPPQQQSQPDFFGSAAAKPAQPDFFGAAAQAPPQPPQQHYQQQPQYQQPPLPPQQPQQGTLDFFGAGGQQQAYQQATPAQQYHQYQQQQQQHPPQHHQPAMSSSPQQGYSSMYRAQDPAPKQAPAGPDPFAALATERPKTPPKHHHYQSSAAPAPAPAPAPVAAAQPPAKKPAASLDDLFA
jgi:stromal membrane-associated protein